MKWKGKYLFLLLAFCFVSALSSGEYYTLSKGQMENLKSLIEMLKVESEGLRNSLKEAGETSDYYEKRIKELESMLTESREIEQSLQKSIGNLRYSLDSSELIIEDLQDSLEKAEKDIRLLNQDLKTLRDSYRKLRARQIRRTILVFIAGAGSGYLLKTALR